MLKIINKFTISWINKNEEYEIKFQQDCNIYFLIK